MESMAHHPGPKGDAPVSVRRQEGATGIYRPRALLGLPQARRGKQGLVCLNNSKGFGGIVAVSRCLVSVSGWDD